MDVSLILSSLWPLWLVVVLIVIVPVAMHVVSVILYERSEYFQTTGYSYSSVRRDTGRYGEYLVWKRLEDLPVPRRFLFNVYVPTADGNTSEIDVLLICAAGLVVMESKNYSGWIFGSETDRHWTVTLPSGRGSQKTRFYNPIRQNQGHVKHLIGYLGDAVPVYSVIVFSERCTLKKVSSGVVPVVKRGNLRAVLDQMLLGSAPLTQAEVQSLYERLLPLTRVTDKQRQAHVQRISELQGDLLR